MVDPPLFYNRVFKKDYAIGLNLTGSSLDDPDQNCCIISAGRRRLDCRAFGG